MQSQITNTLQSTASVCLRDSVTLRNCEWCGVEFRPKRDTARFHHSGCRVQAHRAKHALTIGTRLSDGEKNTHQARPQKDLYVFNQPVPTSLGQVILYTQPKLIRRNGEGPLGKSAKAEQVVGCPDRETDWVTA